RWRPQLFETSARHGPRARAGRGAPERPRRAPDATPFLNVWAGHGLTAREEQLACRLGRPGGTVELRRGSCPDSPTTPLRSPADRDQGIREKPGRGACHRRLAAHVLLR